MSSYIKFDDLYIDKFTISIIPNAQTIHNKFYREYEQLSEYIHGWHQKDRLHFTYKRVIKSKDLNFKKLNDSIVTSLTDEYEDKIIDMFKTYDSNFTLQIFIKKTHMGIDINIKKTNLYRNLTIDENEYIFIPMNRIIDIRTEYK